MPDCKVTTTETSNDNMDEKVVQSATFKEQRRAISEDGEEDCDTSQDAEEYLASGWSPRHGKKERCAPIVLSDGQKDNIVAWVQSNQCLYNKGHSRYKDVEYKVQLWEEKAADFGLTAKALTTWWKNQRTKYGRLTRSVGPNCSGYKGDSEEDAWCRRNLRFLDRFIARTRSRNVDLDARMRQMYPEITLSETDLTAATRDIDDFENESKSSVTGDTETSASVTGLPVLTRGQKRKFSPENESPFVLVQPEVIAERLRPNTELSSNCSGTSSGISSNCEERRHWAAWMSTAMQQIHDSLWPNFMQDSLQLINDYRAKTRALLECAVKKEPATYNDP